MKLITTIYNSLREIVRASRKALFLTMLLSLCQSLIAGVQTDKIQALISDGELSQALALTGDARNADPACALSPFHEKIVKLAEADALDSKAALIFRGGIRA